MVAISTFSVTEKSRNILKLLNTKDVKEEEVHEFIRDFELLVDFTNNRLKEIPIKYLMYPLHEFTFSDTLELFKILDSELYSMETSLDNLLMESTYMGSGVYEDDFDNYLYQSVLHNKDVTKEIVAGWITKRDMIKTLRLSHPQIEDLAYINVETVMDAQREMLKKSIAEFNVEFLKSGKRSIYELPDVLL